MNRPKLRASQEVKIFLATLNLVLCGIFSSTRIRQQMRQSDFQKLSATGLCCMLAAFLQCACVLNTESWWYFGNIERYCDLSLKLATFIYAVYRTLLYMFIILRIELVNQFKTIKRRTIRIGKVVVVIFGIFIMSCSLIFAHGVEDPVLSEGCTFEIDVWIITVSLLADLTICILGTWMFIRPLRVSLSAIEDENLRHMLRWTAIWTTVSLFSTMIAFLITVAIDSAAGCVAFDCSITSFSLLMMLDPEGNIFRRETTCEIELSNHQSEKAGLELTLIDDESSKQSEAQLSDAQMHNDIREVLDESSCKPWSSVPDYQISSKHSPKIIVK